MKYPLLISVFISAVMMSCAPENPVDLITSDHSEAEWTKVWSLSPQYNYARRNTNYVDLSRIRKIQDNIYYLQMQDFSSISTEQGELSSAVSLFQADCSVSRIRFLGVAFYKTPMALGPIAEGKDGGPGWSEAEGKEAVWYYPRDNLSSDVLAEEDSSDGDDASLRAVCDYLSKN